MQTNSIQHRLLSVADYHCMAENGILKDDERLELIKGELIKMAPIGSIHADYVDRLTRLFFKQVDDNVRIRIQNPIYLDEFNEPEPDIALVMDADYSIRHPNGTDVLLVIEVSDSSLHYDRTVKLPQYALHKIPEVWLIDTQQKQIDIYQQPFDKAYRLHLHPQANELIQPLLAKEINVDWQALFVH